MFTGFDTNYLEYNMLYGAHCAGQGLGKNGEGMSEPVKVKLKRDTVGVSEPWQAIDINPPSHSTVKIHSSC